MKTPFGKPLPRPHCEACGIDMWLVDSKPSKLPLLQILTFQCQLCNTQATKLLDLATDRERGASERVAP
jgi:hypothetical protein